MDNNPPRSPSLCRLVAPIALYSLWVVSFTRGVSAEKSLVIGPPGPVFAVAGDDVILPCSLVSLANAEEMTVVWLRRDLKNRNVHRFRNGRDVQDDKNPSYDDRTTLFEDQLKNGNVSLKLSNVTLEDEGNYTCFIPSLPSSEGKRETVIQLIVVAVTVSQLAISNLVSIKGSSQMLPSRNDPSDAGGNRTGLAVGLPLCFLLLILAAIGAGVFIHRRKARGRWKHENDLKKTECEALQNDPEPRPEQSGE